MDGESIEQFNIINISNYIKENTIGLLLLMLVLAIIYCVDYINRLNNLIYSSQNSISIISKKNKINK